MYNILVSGASGIVGYGILRCLKEAGCRTIGTTIYETSPADCFADVVEIVPRAYEEGYIECIIGIISKYKIDMMIPGIEADMIEWNANRDALSRTGTFLLLNRESLVTLCLDKWKFFEILSENHVSCRIESSIAHDFNLFETPFILKPRRGYGSKGVVQIESYDQYKHYEDRIGCELMMQELVGNDDAEYTVSAFFDLESMLIGMIAMKRRLSAGGFTEIAETVDEYQFMPSVIELAELFKPIGPTNFQFRKHKDEWKLLEINPRISSSTSIKAAFGYNESKMAVEAFLEQRKIEKPVIRSGKAIRYMEDFITYDSDNI